MLKQIEDAAETCVARGCGFAALAILTLTVGLSWDMTLASKVGGMLVLIACLVLLAKAWNAPRRPVQYTELWMMLDPHDRPDKRVAQRIVGRTLQGCYLRFARHAAFLSSALLGISLVLGLHTLQG